MIVLPDKYDNLELNKYEKMFMSLLRNKLNDDYYILLKINPTGMKGEVLDALITLNGIILLKFADNCADIAAFKNTLVVYKMIYDESVKIITKRLLGGKNIRSDENTLLFPVSMVLVFGNLEKSEVDVSIFDDIVKQFVLKHCIFGDDIKHINKNIHEFESTVLCNSFLAHQVSEDVSKGLLIGILQRIAPEYTVVRISSSEDVETEAGASDAKMLMDDTDRAMKAFMLDNEQINYVNSIQKGDQLILACAGSGKSVILISKCFKAASLNPNKQFFITCYNKNLKSYYDWLIDTAGFKERNVKCLTFHSLCRGLIKRSGHTVPSDIDSVFDYAVKLLNEGKIYERFYGIFIDEIQVFQREWYKLCYGLLENKSSNEHMFVICGDKSQNITTKAKRGTAPWQGDSSLPNYRGRSLRIEKNYRNCIEINEFISSFIELAKKKSEAFGVELDKDPDMFLRGKSVLNGIGVEIKQLKTFNNKGEINEIINSINEIHDNHKIPYDEIAVIMFQRYYRAKLRNWGDRTYKVLDPLIEELDTRHINYTKLLTVGEGAYGERYGMGKGVVITTFESALGLDFRAVIVCGIKGMGQYHNTKVADVFSTQDEIPELKDDFYKSVNSLYTACTRAKETLYIILSDKPSESIYSQMLLDSKKNSMKAGDFYENL